MLITKKHLSRRTVLKGMGVTLALPFLDAMTPARTSLAATGRKTRFVAVDNIQTRGRVVSPWRAPGAR